MVRAALALKMNAVRERPLSDLDILATEACRARERELFDDEASNRGTTPTPMEPMDEDAEGELCDAFMGGDGVKAFAPIGYFAPIGAASVLPARVPTPVFKPAATGMAGNFASFMQPQPQMQFAQPMTQFPQQLEPQCMPTLLQPTPAAPQQPQPFLAAVAPPPPPPQPPLARSCVAVEPSEQPAEDHKRTGRGPSCCLGRMLALDPSVCDPHFTAPVGGTLRFEHKFCNSCRANGIQVATSRVRLLNPSHEASLCTVGFSHAQNRRFWSFSPLAPARFHLFNDKARCTGPKIVVFESTPEARGVDAQAMREVPPLDEPTPSGEAAIRLWVSYGTLTMQRSRKAFRPEAKRQKAPEGLDHSKLMLQ